MKKGIFDIGYLVMSIVSTLLGVGWVWIISNIIYNDAMYDFEMETYSMIMALIFLVVPILVSIPLHTLDNEPIPLRWLFCVIFQFIGVGYYLLSVYWLLVPICLGIFGSIIMKYYHETW